MAEKQVANNISEFLDIILDEDDHGSALAYRGHSDAKNYKLIAKVFRNLRSKQNEEKILSELLTEAPVEFRDDKTVFEQLVRAQHYGLPTRLLNVSLNPLAALYFAIRDEHDELPFPPDAEVIKFRISEDRVKLFDSDTLSCIANIARLSYVEKNAIYKSFLETKGKGGVSSIDRTSFNDRPEIQRLVHFIRVEKPYFSNSIAPIDLNRFIFVLPRKLNKRLISQSGAFLAAGLLKGVSDEGSTALVAERISIPGAAKNKIRSQLDRLHINEHTLFPEIESASAYIQSKYMD